MTSNQFTKRPPNIIHYLEHNLQESESDDNLELDDNCESDSGKSELDEEYYRLQPPPIPVNVLLANTVRLDRTYINGVSLLNQNDPQPIKNVNKKSNMEPEDINEHYDVWKKRETNKRIGNSSSYTRLEISNNVRPPVPVDNAKNVNGHYEAWKNRGTNNKIENSSSFTGVEIARNVRPSVAVADAELSCCTFLCDGIKSCCVLL